MATVVPTMVDFLLGCFAVAVLVGVAALVHLIRNDRLPNGAMLVVTVGCAAGLLAMILTDWPLENLAKFWADHSILASILSSVLLLSLVFLVYERGEQRRQHQLADGLSGAGAGGIVDHVVDVEVALGLLSSPRTPAELEPESWGSWIEPGRPLRWLRQGRDEILRSDRDPRRLRIDPDQALAPWGRELIDQAIRRLLAAMRDWSPLVGASKTAQKCSWFSLRCGSSSWHCRTCIHESPRRTVPRATRLKRRRGCWYCDPS